MDFSVWADEADEAEEAEEVTRLPLFRCCCSVMDEHLFHVSTYFRCWCCCVVVLCVLIGSHLHRFNDPAKIPQDPSRIPEEPSENPAGRVPLAPGSLH